MAIEIGKVNKTDLVENDYKVLGIGINQSSNNNGIFSVNYTTISQAKQNLQNLILTRKGERIMQPEFGCDIYKILFEPIITDDVFENKISNTITEAVNSWLPYINIDRINYFFDDEEIDKHTINIELLFSLKSNSKISDSVQINVNR
jgi:phage baseplate assembly protein W